ncbi:hypothetical protein V8E51_002435 [Hyaloscypha variabilis]
MEPFPADAENQNYVTVHALSAGFLDWPDQYFVQPCLEGARTKAPSLAFLIQHHSPETGKPTRIVFDLGIRKNIDTYPEALKKHIANHLSVITEPDVSDSLRLGDLAPKDIDFVVLSHVHWDHVGTPSDFGMSRFVVGNGSLGLLAEAGNLPPAGSTSLFEADLLPPERTTELPGVDDEAQGSSGGGGGTWQKFGPLRNVIDIFSDGSVYLVNSPGHLDGHLNLLVRLGPGNFLYLAGDACHDRRILRKELGIATWKNLHGEARCIHSDKEATEKTIDLIVGLEKMDGVEVVLAHDVEWLNREGNKKRFWPGKM